MASEGVRAGGENRLLEIVRQPRIVLLLLAAWEVVGVLSQVLVESELFLDTHGIELDGALGGRALAFQGLALAVLYVYASRDPRRHQQVFWLALIAQGAGVAAALYHWAAGTYSFESVAASIAVGGFLAILVFLHLFEMQPAERPSGSER
jgi:hypothetical protein